MQFFAKPSQWAQTRVFWLLTVFSAAQRQATRVAIERLPGVRKVEDHLVYYVQPAVLV